MAGIGLTQAVRGFIDGKEARYRHDEMDQQRQRQARIDAANQRAAGVLNSSKQEAIAAGQDIAQWRPNDMTMLRAAQERGAAFAEAGDWEDFMRNEAALAPQRQRVRAQALQRFKADGDFGTFAKTAYATMPDGKDIVAVERTGGSPALPSIGREATPASYKVKLSDGSEHEVNPDEVVKLVEQTLVDPQAVAMNEAKLAFETALARIKGEEERATVRERGRLSLDEVATRGRQERETLGTKFGYDSKLQGQKDEAALKRTDKSGQYSLQSAGISASARRYAADKSGGGKDGDKPPTDKEIRDAVRSRYGGGPLGAFSSERSMNATSNEVALTVRELMDANPGLDLTRAIDEAAKLHGAKVTGED